MAIDSDVLAVPPRSGPAVVTLIAHDGEEPPASLDDREAEATWAAVTAPWHPAVLARLGELPRVEPLESPYAASPGELRLVPAGGLARLPSGYRTSTDDIGATLMDGEADRPALVRTLLDRIEPGANPGDPADPIARDFLALGTARWLLRDLTIGMGHVDSLDLAHLTREALAGARAWRDGDANTARSHLRGAFELLTQARERFYPVDAYLVDLCLLDPATPSQGLAEMFDSRAPITLLAPARAIESLAEREPDRVVALRQAIDEGWADVIGGTYTEEDEPLRPVESILWQFRKGGEVYRAHLDQRNVETLARRRFGLYPQLPQVARRFGFRFALHLALDSGRFPIPPESKRLWESPDGSYLEALTRPPLAADRAAVGLRLPWTLARTMRDDHVATIGLVHWPSPVAGWFDDLRRVVAYSPVLVRWATLGDYFGMTDRPFEMFRPEPDQYVTPYLSRAVAGGGAAPISQRAEHARARARVDAVSFVRSVAVALGAVPPPPIPSADEPAPPDPLSEAEESVETGQFGAARPTLDRLQTEWSTTLAGAVVGSGSGRKPGFLIANPLGFARRAAVLLPDAAADLRPEGPLRGAQFTEEGVWAVVDLPAFGYAWVPRDATDAPMPGLGAVSARGRTLRNEAVELDIDEATGGIRSFRAAGEPTARLGQQLVMTGLVGPEGKPAHTKMRAESVEVDYGGPALVQAVSAGVLADPGDGRPLARYRQRFRLWTGRPTAELDIVLSDLDPDWLARAAAADPWEHFLSCRWAWPDANAMLRRLVFHAPELTDVDRPETPDALDISTRRQRSAILFGGLAHHRRHGPRMLDTILVAGREHGRRFAFGLAADLEHPAQAALDLTAPAVVIPTDAGPPRPGPVGWFFRLDHANILVTRVEAVPPDEDRPHWSLAFHLLETAGHAARGRLRLVRNPTAARQTDLHREPIVDLGCDGDTVHIDLTPHELARVEVELA